MADDGAVIGGEESRPVERPTVVDRPGVGEVAEEGPQVVEFWSVDF